ncbi:MAG: 1-deoxy-D-xylulose-5-phosphate synthase [Bifidobacterium sp.]|nr:1-deoxy-D-xylulose-5-phosphate synthase [Bifidobacterium sp.]
MTDYLSEVDYPADLRKMPVEDLPELCEQIRDVLIRKVSATGGHMGPNLGVVEATVALHYVFDTPKDDLIWDVSHQSYTHKILTGRKRAFLDPAHYHDVSGYTHPSESPYDLFTVGHTGTSISMAVGMAKARDLKHEKHNVIAFIGDGSLGEGEALEGLDNAGEMDTNLIIVVNDNGWAIEENHGGMYRNLKELRETNGQAESNIFRDFGLDYRFVGDGNDVEELVRAFREVRNIDHPVVVHIVTDKGRGLEWAERDKEAGHWCVPDKVYDERKANPPEFDRDYAQILPAFLLDKVQADPTVVVMTPATAGDQLPPAFRKAAGAQYVDVGIAEQHAVAACSGLGKAGCKPVLEVNNTFLQRAYDQLQQDLAVNGNPTTILDFGIAPGINRNDNTHSGVAGIAMVNTIPGLTCLAPATCEELLAMMDWSIDRAARPVVITMPMRGVVHEADLPFTPVDPVTAGAQFTDADLSFRTMVRGSGVAVLALGDMLPHGAELVKALKDELGVEATLVSPRLYSSLDTRALDALAATHDVFVTLEDGERTGGFGETVADHFGGTATRVLVRGADKELPDLVPTKELFERYRLTIPQLVADVKAQLG